MDTQNSDQPTGIAGYTYGTSAAAKSPVSLEDLERLKQSATLTAEDERYLRMAGDLLDGQEHEVVQSWRSVIGSEPHLAHAFFGPDGKPDENYKTRVGERFARWVLDTCRRPYDQAWLDYQQEISLRHTPSKKNKTDGADTPSVVPLRYLIAFSAVIVTTLKPFLAGRGHSDAEVEKMQQAWCKSVMIQIALWSLPYTMPGEW